MCVCDDDSFLFKIMISHLTHSFYFKVKLYLNHQKKSLFRVKIEINIFPYIATKKNKKIRAK